MASRAVIPAFTATTTRFVFGPTPTLAVFPAPRNTTTIIPTSRRVALPTPPTNITDAIFNTTIVQRVTDYANASRISNETVSAAKAFPTPSLPQDGTESQSDGSGNFDQILSQVLIGISLITTCLALFNFGWTITQLWRSKKKVGVNIVWVIATFLWAAYLICSLVAIFILYYYDPNADQVAMEKTHLFLLWNQFILRLTSTSAEVLYMLMVLYRLRLTTLYGMNAAQFVTLTHVLDAVLVLSNNVSEVVVGSIFIVQILKRYRIVEWQCQRRNKKRDVDQRSQRDLVRRVIWLLTLWVIAGLASTIAYFIRLIPLSTALGTIFFVVMQAVGDLFLTLQFSIAYGFWYTLKFLIESELSILEHQNTFSDFKVSRTTTVFSESNTDYSDDEGTNLLQYYQNLLFASQEQFSARP
ncbi:hypothetical protein HK102_011696 [Quaeritorhiza haematococci]|nr:hypothetical protein HK102_011696 [Quaeritorhiza haematococci]